MKKRNYSGLFNNAFFLLFKVLYAITNKLTVSYWLLVSE